MAKHGLSRLSPANASTENVLHICCHQFTREFVDVGITRPEEGSTEEKARVHDGEQKSEARGRPSSEARSKLKWQNPCRGTCRLTLSRLYQL